MCHFTRMNLKNLGMPILALNIYEQFTAFPKETLQEPTLDTQSTARAVQIIHSFMLVRTSCHIVLCSVRTVY